MSYVEKISGVDHSCGRIGGTPVVGQEFFVRSRARVRLSALETHVFTEVCNAGDLSGI